MLHSGKHFEKRILGDVLGDIGEEDGLGGQTAGAEGRSPVRLA